MVHCCRSQRTPSKLPEECFGGGREGAVARTVTVPMAVLYSEQCFIQSPLQIDQKKESVELV